MGIGSPATGDGGLHFALAALAFLLAQVQLPVVGLVTIFFLAGGGLIWPDQLPLPASPWSIPSAALLIFNLVALGGFVTGPRKRGWLLMTSQAADFIAVVVIFAGDRMVDSLCPGPDMRGGVDCAAAGAPRLIRGGGPLVAVN